MTHNKHAAERAGECKASTIIGKTALKVENEGCVDCMEISPSSDPDRAAWPPFTEVKSHF